MFEMIYLDHRQDADAFIWIIGRMPMPLFP
jgi:hypothetical protein